MRRGSMTHVFPSAAAPARNAVWRRNGPLPCVDLSRAAIAQQATSGSGRRASGLRVAKWVRHVFGPHPLVELLGRDVAQAERRVLERLVLAERLLSDPRRFS